MAPWIAALGATLLMQSVASFMTQSLPVVAPLITASAGLAPERVGNFSSLTALGTVLFLLLGGPFLARMGPVLIDRLFSNVHLPGHRIHPLSLSPDLLEA